LRCAGLVLKSLRRKYFPTPTSFNGFLSYAAALSFACAGFATGGCRSETALTPKQEEGKHLYDVRCAHCHEENDLGFKQPPPNLRGVFSRSTLPSGAPATDPEVQKVVLQGKGMMPSFAGRFTSEQMADLLAYLHKGIR
jgi:mono/diheme cytochrome c family protein